MKIDLFKKSPKAEVTEFRERESIEKPLEHLLLGTSPGHYVALVSRDREAILGPIKDELSQLESQEKRLREMYDQAVERHENATQIEKAFAEIHKKVQEKEKELSKARCSNQIDLGALLIATKLDSLKDEKRVFDLYQVIGRMVNDMIPLLEEIVMLNRKNGFLNTAECTLNTLYSVVWNMNNDLCTSVRKNDGTELRNRLNKRLNQLKETKEKEQQLKELASGTTVEINPQS